jgi:hypothetical protein
MALRNLNNWIQIATNLSILAGLILVIVQIQQNTEAIHTQILTQDHQSEIELEQNMLGENPAVIWAKSIESPKSLNLAEQRVLEAYLWSQLERWRFAYEMAELGNAPPDKWKEGVERQAAFFLGSGYGLAWWKSTREHVLTLPAELRDLIDQSISAGPPTKIYFERVLKKLEN